MNGKRYFNEIKKEICLHQLFSKLHHYFSTKSPRTSIPFHQRCSSFWNPSFVFCPSNLLAPIVHLWTALPSVLLYSHQHTDHHNRLAFVCEFQLEELFRGLEFNNSTLFELNIWKLFHFDVHLLRTVSICVFKVKYDGREIPCDYTEPVSPRYVWCK